MLGTVVPYPILLRLPCAAMGGEVLNKSMGLKLLRPGMFLTVAHLPSTNEAATDDASRGNGETFDPASLPWVAQSLLPPRKCGLV